MDTSTKRAPTLRFPEFSNSWGVVKLASVFYERDERYDDSLEPLSVTIERGVIKRSEIERKDNTSEDRSNYKAVKRGDVVYNSMRMWQGASGVSEYIGYVSPAYTVLVPKANQQAQFYGHYFKKPRIIDTFRRYSQGLTSDTWNLKYAQLATIKIAIPSLDEQEKIAEFMHIVDEKISALQKKREATEIYKKGIMHSIFSQKIRFKNKAGEEYPVWREKKLGDLCKTAKSGGTPTATNRLFYDDGTIPFLSISDMTQQGKYLYKTSKFISELGLKNSTSWIVPRNSLIYSMYASVGYPAINKIPIATSQAVLNLIPGDDTTVDFLYYSLLDYRKKVHRVVETGTQGNLNAQTVKKIKIKLPALDEQKKIVDFLSAIDEKIKLTERELEQTRRFKKALLQQMFV